LLGGAEVRGTSGGLPVLGRIQTRFHQKQRLVNLSAALACFKIVCGGLPGGPEEDHDVFVGIGGSRLVFELSTSRIVNPLDQAFRNRDHRFGNRMMFLLKSFNEVCRR